MRVSAATVRRRSGSSRRSAERLSSSRHARPGRPTRTRARSSSASGPGERIDRATERQRGRRARPRSRRPAGRAAAGSPRRWRPRRRRSPAARAAPPASRRSRCGACAIVAWPGGSSAGSATPGEAGSRVTRAGRRRADSTRATTAPSTRACERRHRTSSRCRIQRNASPSSTRPTRDRGEPRGRSERAFDLAARREPEEREEAERQYPEDRAGEPRLRRERADLPGRRASLAQGARDLVEHARQVAAAAAVQREHARQQPGVVGVDLAVHAFERVVERHPELERPVELAQGSPQRLARLVGARTRAPAARSDRLGWRRRSTSRRRPAARRARWLAARAPAPLRGTATRAPPPPHRRSRAADQTARTRRAPHRWTKAARRAA